MARRVKLTRREPTQAACDAGVDKIDENTRCDVSNYGLSADVEIDDEAPQECWQAMHDAAPDDATKALADLLWAVQQLRHGPNSEYAVHARYVDTYLGKFAQTPEGAALIRQEEELDDGTL